MGWLHSQQKVIASLQLSNILTSDLNVLIVLKLQVSRCNALSLWFSYYSTNTVWIVLVYVYRLLGPCLIHAFYSFLNHLAHRLVYASESLWTK